VQGNAGNFVLRNRTTRWICFACQRRRAIGATPVAQAAHVDGHALACELVLTFFTPPL